MKIGTIILSMYLILLSCLPCPDAKVNDNQFGNTSSVTISHTHSHKKEKESDICPPFCTCSCCPAQALTFNSTFTFTFTSENPLIISPIPTYDSIFKSNFFGSIWQPPKLV